MNKNDLMIETHVDYPCVTTLIRTTIDGRERCFAGTAVRHPDDPFNEAIGAELSTARAMRKYSTFLEKRARRAADHEYHQQLQREAAPKKKKIWQANDLRAALRNANKEKLTSISS